MLTRLTPKQLEVISNNNGLQRYLESLLEGKAATPRSWLYEDESPEAVRDEWLKRLAVLEKGSAPERRVFQFDTAQLEKWGPQGEVAPIEELMGTIEKGFGSSPTPKTFSTEAWKKAKANVTRMLTSITGGALRPASFRHVVDDMRVRDTLESNSGWPLFTRRNKPEVVQQSIADAQSGAWRDYPAIALFRNYNLKTRLVWMYPMATNLVEGSYFQVLQSALIRKQPRFLAPWIGFEAVRDYITHAYDMDWFLSASDFAATDEHFKKAQSLQVYDVIAPCFASQYQEGLKESLMHMHEIPLIVGPDAVMVGDHGVSSGSNWTNFVETIFDWILSEFVALCTQDDTSGTAQSKRVSFNYQNPTGCYVPASRLAQGLYAIGDDMAWVQGRYDPSFAEDLELFGKDVGMEIKAEKTTNEKDWVKSLQRLFIYGYNRPDGKIRAVYSTVRALKSSIYPERFHKAKDWSSDMFCARQFMILENCVDHPLFEEFVKFVVRGQKDLIPFSRLSASKLNRIQRHSKLLPGLNPTYNQEKRDESLGSFESIRIASKL